MEKKSLIQYFSLLVIALKKKLAIKHTYENSLEKGLAWGRVLGFSLELHPFLGPPTPTTLPPHLVSAQGCRKDRALP